MRSSYRGCDALAAVDADGGAVYVALAGTDSIDRRDLGITRCHRQGSRRIGEHCEGYV